MIRIALASIHPRSLSGQIEGLVGLAQALSGRGHTVQIVSAFPNRDLLGGDRLQLARAPQRILIDQPVRISRIFARLVRLSSQVDLIQLNLPTPAFSILADLLQTFVRVPVVVGYEAHLVRIRDLMQRGHVSQAPAFYLPRLLVNNRIVARLTLHRAACYTVSTQYQKTELIALGVQPDRIHQVPTVLPFDKMMRTPHTAVQAQFPSGRRLTYIGHYNHVKGVDVLVRAFRALAARYPDLHLVLAWSGLGKSDAVRALLQDSAFQGRVLELGRLNVQDLFSASDVVALPYRLTMGQAAHPTTLLEAFAANVPVVTTDLPVLREMTDEGKMARLVPPDDPTALAAMIERILNEPSFVQPMLRAQRDWIEQIQPARAVGAYEQLYEQILAKHKTAVLRAD
ncbi:MAG TPA: glycosyltransferase [Anaerolineae bacterium]